MKLACPELASYLRALRNALQRIDSFWELPDELKDQRKYVVFADVVAATCGMHDDEFMRQAMQVMVDDGLDKGMVELVCDGAIERARLAAEYREAVSPPKRVGASWDNAKRRAVNFEPRPARELSRASRDAVDWLVRYRPGELDAFLESHSGDELDLIVAYLEEVKGNGNGGQ